MINFVLVFVDRGDSGRPVFFIGKAASKRAQSCLHELPSVSRLTNRQRLVNPRPLFVGIVETTKSKIRYDERQRHWLEVAEY